jgi:hypothetical protein
MNSTLRMFLYLLLSFFRFRLLYYFRQYLPELSFRFYLYSRYRCFSPDYLFFSFPDFSFVLLKRKIS